MRKLLCYAALLLGVVACTVEAHARTWDAVTGRILTDHWVKITIQDVALDVKGQLIRVGYASTSSGQGFELFDRDGDGEPDLGRNPQTGKYYEIETIETIEDGPMPSALVTMYRNDVTDPIGVMPKRSGHQILTSWGADPITANGGGVVQHANVLLYELTPGDSPDDALVRIGVRQSVAWTWESFQRHPQLRYELLVASSTDAQPWAMVAHVQGTVRDVVRWLVANGTLSLNVPGVVAFHVQRKGHVRVLLNGATFDLEL